VKDVNGIFERGDVDHSLGTGGFSHPDFPDTGTDNFHRLPVVWIKTTLKPVDLETNIAARVNWK
jgi:hypothetical protein